MDIVVIVFVVLGGSIIEKYFKMVNDIISVDVVFLLDLNEFFCMVFVVKNIKRVLGEFSFRLVKSE